MRNTSKKSPQDEVANRNKKFMAADERNNHEESGRKRWRPFALSFVTSRFYSQLKEVQWLNIGTIIILFVLLVLKVLDLMQ